MGGVSFKKERNCFAGFGAFFLAAFFLPVGMGGFDTALLEALHLVKWYAREHVLLCLVPAFFIAGGISVFVSQASVMKYLGAGANRFLAYSVAAVSGTILAVCSCTVLPLFAGIYRMGAGIGPASAFLYSGPAINVLAVILTARILGMELGIARAVGAIFFSVIIGLAMHFFFRSEEEAKVQAHLPPPSEARPLWKNALFFATMVAILVFANWARPEAGATGIWSQIFASKWLFTAISAAVFAWILGFWFPLAWGKVLAVAAPVVALALMLPSQPLIPFVAGTLGLALITAGTKGEPEEWFGATWTLAKQILPLLFAGVLVAGLLLGSPQGKEGLIPKHLIAGWVGGNSFEANLFAALAGAFMYFATLTEVPILQGLLQHGMGKGPALALLLAGPALSLPNMLVITRVMGVKKTVVFVLLVVVVATTSGLLFGSIYG